MDERREEEELELGVVVGAYQGTEVASHTADLVFEDLVVEAGLELALARGRGGDVHGGLATAEDDEVLLVGDAGAVERGVGGVRLQDLEVAGGDQPGRLVLGGRDEVGVVGGPLQVRDGLVQLVDGDVEVLLAGLCCRERELVGQSINFFFLSFFFSWAPSIGGRRHRS